ncbi:polyadenylate-binding protein-interacting protein 5-like [Quercus lobata]|uniref:CUE domain-containing protein n=1 Tax=Quercus lobata TaxID=97700 RepID=A0A7N2L1A2_QUELO|nr:polyadenylate-binding protein-interacting protein 5-like [Quercus lobata]XP_030954442.1 polyadenylate-binding protein-interacting protein 5-like [Quercus lobata]
MKPGMSSLNPNAALYIPLHKQETKDKNQVSVLTTEDSLKNVGKTTWSNCPPNGPVGMNQSYPQAGADYDIHDVNELLIGNDFTKKGVQNSSELTKKQCVDEDPEMDLAYLAIMFPNMSEQSLADVYSVNEGDLETSIDMLNELELSPVDFSEHLPSRLDIGDVSECKVTEGSSMNQKIIFSGEASGSSAGPSGSSF